MFLCENSVGNITRLLKVDRGWAEFFHQRCGKLAFQVTNWLVSVSQNSSSVGMFQQGPQGEPEREIQEMLLSLPQYDPARYRNASGPVGPDHNDPITSAIKSLKASMSLRRVLSTPNPDQTTLKATEEKAQDDVAETADVSGLGEEFLKLPNGFVWKTVSDEDFCGFAGPMKQCMDTAGDDQMFVLFDPRGRPHVVASYDKRRNSFDQIAGKSNSVPSAKYRPMIDALLQSMGAKLRRGEKSLGSHFEFEGE